MDRIIKKSRQRGAMLDILLGTKSHPSASWLYDMLKKDFPKISLATVYRNLNLLLKTGDIIKLDVGNGTEHYDAATHSHYHFVCKCCNCIYDVDMAAFENADETASTCLNADVTHHSLVFYGTCYECKQK